jgi:cytochrome c-type biogenesis protein CcmH
MLVFWSLATVMTVVALLITLVPLLRARSAVAGPSEHAAALEVLRGQRREIESDIASGILAADARDEALSELLVRAGEDLPADSSRAPTAAMRKPWIPAAIVAIAIPALAFGIYGTLGTPSALDVRPMAGASADDKQIMAMVESLARKVRDRPDDVQGWSLLGRSMATVGRFQEAADAYEHLSKLMPGDANVLADWADVLGMAQGRSLLGRPREIARQALDADPKHPKALALMGTAELDAGDFGSAVAYWERLRDQLPQSSPDAEEARTIIAEIRARAAAAGKPLPGGRVEPVAGKPAAGAVGSVSGSVELAFSVAAKVSGKETLFIFARAEGGPRTPLAVVRTSAATLPLAFALDDSQAMAPGINISSAPALRVEARISRSGNVTPQPGDLVGTSAVVKPGARGVKIVVDKVLP